MQLEGKTIIVTGGAGILGQSVAQEARQQGAEVVLLDIVADFASDLGRCITVDLTDGSAVAQTLDEVGDFHGLANVAGGFAMGPSVFDTPDDLWEQMQTINVTTLRTMLTHAIPRLLAKKSGNVVNIGAFGALQGQGNMGAYTAAKSTVMRLTEALSEEVKDEGINVNAVLPSLIDTPRNRADMPDADFSTWVSPEDLAAVICFLLSDQARAVHGALLPVRGLV
ncbi:MAG: SDR family oxidoreductase [Pseudomonadaceae bacterium]|nr:SDR family oxidoreductase [Pseudomonadaceae bacterium]